MNSSFKRAFIPFLLLLSSCSSFFKKNLAQPIEVKDYVKKICLSSEGKGRLTSKAGKHLFRYEAALDSDTKSWQMALQLPLHGERMMTLSWDDLGITKIKGSFYTQVMGALSKEKKSKQQKLLLKRFLRFLAYIAKLKNEIDSNQNLKIECLQGECIALNESFTWYQNDSEKLIKQKINDRFTLVLKGISDVTDYFQKLSFTLENTRESFPSSNPLELNLFLASCDSSK
jgi:hypothetical protein